MIDIRNLSDNAIMGLIGMIILVFIKGILSFIGLIYLDKSLFKTHKTYVYIKETLDIIINTILFIIAFFILFFRKNNSILVIILALLFLLKGFLDYEFIFSLYTYMNVSDEFIAKSEQVKKVNSFITNTILFGTAIYMLNIIFINK